MLTYKLMLKKHYPPFLLNGTIVLVTFFLMLQSKSDFGPLAIMGFSLLLGILLNFGLGIYYSMRGERILGGLYLGVLAVIVLVFLGLRNSIGSLKYGG